ncbi:hypothetical protein BU16DRAFT_182923 [Lophium mytilinum]|uniref:DNA recombination and repair protein Rad51-like C-terminal domain-containing protein n=1 Tax=Lophium mytilinum TaxID=390894 RepID=A0A6A6QBW0_9PEZI|nr:hypothetical protein BU16DRAFT_182923 [Lophium mytilinum]
MQAAVNALRAGGRVVWIDGAAPLVARRLEELLSAPPTDETPSSIPSTAPKLSSAELRNRFHHYKPSTLAHLLALIIHPPSSFPPPDTSLIVIDSLSTLFDNAYPRNADDRSTRNKNDAVRWAAGRKFAVLNDLSSALRKTAALHNNSVLLTCQTITRMRSGARALLLPAMSGGDWDSGISTRLVLFRDWLPVEGPWSAEDDDRMRRARFIGVVKANGVSLAGEGGVGRVIPFTIETAGLHDLNLTTADITPQPQPQTVGTSLAQAVRPPKRAFAEIADSEDEEDGPDSDQLYGWAEDDDVAAEGLLIIEQQPSAPAVPPSHTAQGADAAAGRSEMPAG